MKYVKFIMRNGYCGCDEEEYEAFEDNVSEKEIEDYAKELKLMPKYANASDKALVELAKD
jgi:hypothetical protein